MFVAFRHWSSSLTWRVFMQLKRSREAILRAPPQSARPDGQEHGQHRGGHFWAGSVSVCLWIFTFHFQFTHPFLYTLYFCTDRILFLLVFISWVPTNENVYWLLWDMFFQLIICTKIWEISPGTVSWNLNLLKSYSHCLFCPSNSHISQDIQWHIRED